jgi:predicted Zn-dependent protease with MMP-like domain
MDREAFESLVDEAVDSLPRPLLQRIQNVEIVVEARPSWDDLRAGGIPPGGTLLGLYHGVPLGHRGTGYNMVMPDVISIYQEPIESICGTNPERIREQVRITVLHEIGHYFGIDDDRLHELGMG